MNYLSTYQSPLGELTLLSDGEFLTGLWFEGQKYFGSTLFGEAIPESRLAVFQEVGEWLDCYFSGRDPQFLPPLKVEGTEFRKTVSGILLSVPFGTTITYGQIAERVAEMTGKKSMSSQAVGGAVAHNPISIIIPCHRVIGADGSLTGYAGGMERKKMLLQLEGVGIQ